MIGETISHYRIVARIGVGGMGEVYRAHDPRLNRDVAVKVLPASLDSDAERLARFEREARAAGALNHPNILAIYDVGSHDGVPYIVSELLEGETLRDRISSGVLTGRKAVEIGIQVAEGLAAAHGKGIVHRDLKPENVFLTRDGHAKILDFGLAKLIQRGPRADDATGGATDTILTEAGSVMGTVSYMSPEQLHGAEVDHRSDIFSFGVVLYEMLSGRRPFEGDSQAQIVASILRDEPSELSLAGQPAPPALDRIVRQCLEKRPSDRFESAHDLAFTLRAVTEALSSAPVPKSPPRGRRKFGGAAAVVAALAVVAGAVWWVATRDAAPPLPAEKRIAVLPFTAAGGDPEHALLAAGLAETVADGMVLLEEQSRGRMWVVRPADAGALDRAWRRFNISLGISGDLAFSGDRVRLDLKLLDAASGRALRRDLIDDQVSNLTSLQSEPILRIATMAGIEVAPETAAALESVATNVQRAYMHLLRGRGLLGEPGGTGTELAIGAVEQAIEEDPGYAVARIALASACGTRFTETLDRAWLERGLEETRRALELGVRDVDAYLEQGALFLAGERLDDAIAAYESATRHCRWRGEAFLRLGYAYERAGRLEQAEAAYQTAINLRPDYSVGHRWLGYLYWTENRLDAAANKFRDATRAAPNNYGGYNNLGGLLGTQGRREEARAAFERSLEVEANADAYSQLGVLDFLESRFGDAARRFEQAVAMAPDDWLLLGNLANAYHWGGQQEQAEEAFRRAIAVGEQRIEGGDDDPFLLASVAGYHAMVGQRGRSLELLDAVTGRQPTQARVLGKVAETYEDLGEREAAIEWIGRALAQGLPAAWVHQRPSLRRLEEDPRFRELVKAHGLP